MIEFVKKSEMNILFMGGLAIDLELINALKSFYTNLYLETQEENILSSVKKYKPQAVVTTYSYKDIIYDDTLRYIKLNFPETQIIMLVSEGDCEFMKKILSLECDSYIYISQTKDKIIKKILFALNEAQHRIDSERNEQYYKVLLENSIVSKSDLEGNITYINENFTKITGYTKEECYGKNHNLLRHPNNPDSVYQDMWHTIKEGKIWRERVLNKNKDGSDFWAETIIIPYRNRKTDEIEEYIAIRRDITSMLQMKRKLMKQENEAKEQNKIAEAKDSFLILFTHELKTPLNAIINFSKYLLNHVSKETIDKIPLSKRQHLLEQILSSAEMMLGDVTNILDISRIKSHKLSYTLSSFDVEKLLVEVIEHHKALAEENGVEVVFQSDGSTPFITSDRQRVSQILANVISNAIKYSYGKANIYLLSEAEGVKIIVEDNGAGVKDKESIFELFEQSGKGLLKKEKKGTGIGLSFVKLLCEDLDLEYQLEDSKDLGGLKFVLLKKR